MEKSSQIAWKIVPLRLFFPLKVVPLIEVLLYPGEDGLQHGAGKSDDDRTVRGFFCSKECCAQKIPSGEVTTGSANLVQENFDKRNNLQREKCLSGTIFHAI
jgi:hypothetical protein